nr:copper-transporting ATPase PAA2, chloroplastic [Tanacetum cinerariifolium]
MINDVPAPPTDPPDTRTGPAYGGSRASGLGIEEKVKKWRESVVRKEELMVESRNRVVFAWTLVALCCGSHASHIAHSVGFHIGHGAFMELLHNSYFKGSLAVGALLGPGRGPFT